MKDLLFSKITYSRYASLVDKEQSPIIYLKLFPGIQ
jgi:hypothetical protein